MRLRAEALTQNQNYQIHREMIQQYFLFLIWDETLNFDGQD
jgi:hypothetical protein